MKDHEVMVTTEVGSGRMVWRAPEATPTAVLLLGHGAGGQLDALDLRALAAELPSRGIVVARFEQPWRTAGRRMSAPAPQLDLAWQAAVAAVREQWPDVPVVVGGRSQGSRVACRTADELDAAGVVCLAFPLHPPGRPEKTRLPELLTPTVPVLVCQGSRDTFGSAGDVRAAASGAENVTVVEIAGADHSMRVRKADGIPQAAVDGQPLHLDNHPAVGLVVETVASFVAGFVA